MNGDTLTLFFVVISLSVGITLLALYSSFGPGAEQLMDPFEEEEN
jgi:hypothetical protein